jgi:hypothetical protein
MAPGSDDANMSLPFARWPARRIGTLWGVGLLLEAALLSVMFVLLVRPEPPLVARLRGAGALRATVTISVDTVRFHGPVPAQLPPGIPPTPPDSFYTVLHWPLTKPLLAGGGHVIVLPMGLWWVPALYVGLVPLLLLGLSGVWLWGRRRPPLRPDPAP